MLNTTTGSGKNAAAAVPAAVLAMASSACAVDVSIIRFGAKGDGETINTEAIHTTIDQAAAAGGGTAVVPNGEFVSGALFLKTGSRFAVLHRFKNFPEQRTRIEGHFEERFNPALITTAATGWRCRGLPGSCVG